MFHWIEPHSVSAQMQANSTVEECLMCSADAFGWRLLDIIRVLKSNFELLYMYRNGFGSVEPKSAKCASDGTRIANRSEMSFQLYTCKWAACSTITTYRIPWNNIHTKRWNIKHKKGKKTKINSLNIFSHIYCNGSLDSSYIFVKISNTFTKYTLIYTVPHKNRYSFLYRSIDRFFSCLFPAHSFVSQQIGPFCSIFRLIISYSTQIVFLLCYIL